MGTAHRKTWGGARLGAGRLQRNIKLSPEAAHELAILTRQRKIAKPDMTEDQVVQDLIYAAWLELDSDHAQAERNRS